MTAVMLERDELAALIAALENERESLSWAREFDRREYPGSAITAALAKLRTAVATDAARGLPLAAVAA